ncbi:MAG TPA: hypothetical protein VKE41_11220 [Roseiflexaceae bacterium]|nr:hypothetical protein [Roseiflexaceae bacterium]
MRRSSISICFSGATFSPDVQPMGAGLLLQQLEPALVLLPQL